MNGLVEAILIVLFVIACVIAGEIAAGFARRRTEKKPTVVLNISTPDAESFRKATDGLKFPPHPVRPTMPLVFDDTELAAAKKRKPKMKKGRRSK